MVGDVLTDSMIARAHEGRANFETAERRDFQEYLRLRAAAPQWLHDLVRAAHRDGEVLPDDWRYHFTLDALTAIGESEAGMTQADVAASVEPDTYDIELAHWLGANTTRLAYCDEVLEETGTPQSTSALLAEGQRLERLEVFAAVWARVAAA